MRLIEPQRRIDHRVVRLEEHLAQVVARPSPPLFDVCRVRGASVVALTHVDDELRSEHARENQARPARRHVPGHVRDEVLHRPLPVRHGPLPVALRERVDEPQQLAVRARQVLNSGFGDGQRHNGAIIRRLMGWLYRSKTPRRRQLVPAPRLFRSSVCPLVGLLDCGPAPRRVRHRAAADYRECRSGDRQPRLIVLAGPSAGFRQRGGSLGRA